MESYRIIQVKARAAAGRKAKKRYRRLCRQGREIIRGQLEQVANEGSKHALEDTLEAERDEFLARKRHARTPDPDPETFRGYRNGYYTRTVTTGNGQVAVDMPKVAGGNKLFESQILPPYLRTSPALLETLPELYLHGLSCGDFRPALSGLLGERAVLSASAVSRLNQKWYEEYLVALEQPLDSHYAYVYADGVYLKVGPAPEKLALLVVVGVDRDGRKRLLALLPGNRESYANWLDVMRHLAGRGVVWIGLIIADGIPGLWRAAGEVFPATPHQRDWMHKIRNILDKLPQARRFHQQAYRDLLKIYLASTRAEAEHGIERFAHKYRDHRAAVNCLLESVKELTAYFDFPREHWHHLRTSNPVESPFDPVRTRLNKTKRVRLETTATGMVFQLLLKRQARWKRLRSPSLAALVVSGARFRDGVLVTQKARSA